MKAVNSVYSGILALFFALFYLIPLDGRLLWQPDESRYAEVSREMLQRGDWIVPRLLGLRYFEKPVAGYWFNNISQWLFGDSNFAVRFGVAFSTGMSALLVFALAMLMWRQRRIAFLATLIFLSMLLVFGVGTYSVLDPMVALWLMAAMFSYYLTLHSASVKQRLGAYILLGLACGMGVLTKGFLALVVPVIAVLPIVIHQRRVKELFIYGPAAVLAALLLCLPWALAIARREPDFWHYFFWVEHIQRFADENAQHRAPFWYYIPMLMAGSLPWLALLPGSLLKGWRERATRPELFFLLSWVVMPLLFFSAAKGKLLTYILPCMAPLALLMAAYACDCIATLRHRVFKLNAGINIAFGLICITALALMGIGLIFQNHVYSRQEWPKIIIGILAFSGWILFAIISLRPTGKRWPWMAACPLLFGLLVDFMMPQYLVDSKQPQHFARVNVDLLKPSKFILTKSNGTATSLAWVLKRSDIDIYQDKGELGYGLAYPDAQNRYIADADFADWLVRARRQGDVSLILRLSSDEDLTQNLPAPDILRQSNRLALYFYRQQP